MRSAVAVLLVAVVMAGCASPGPGVSPPNPENAKVLEQGALTEGADLSFSWPLEGVARRHDVRLSFEGLPPSSTYTVDGFTYRLVDGAGQVVAEQPARTAVTGSNSCVVCLQPDGALGTWTFTFSAGPSLASYRFEVDTEY